MDLWTPAQFLGSLTNGAVMSIWSVKIKIGTYNPKLPNRQNCQIWGILGHFRKKKLGWRPRAILGGQGFGVRSF